jgi:DNA-binding MarR family transcriptional regulator
MTTRKNSLGRLIYRTSQTMRNHAENLLRPYDLTSEQFHLLKNMDTRIGRSQNELGKLAGKSPANITRILDRMEKKGLIVRKNNPKDRRSYLVFQTENGHGLVTAVSRQFAPLADEIEKGISQDDIRAFKKVLARIDNNLRRLAKRNGVPHDDQ